MNLVWLRNDLRMEDNPALYYASVLGPVCCVYTVTSSQWDEHNDAPIKLALWRKRLMVLQQELATKNIPLKLIVSPHYQTVVDDLLRFIESLSISGIFFNNEYALNEKKRDDDIEQRCQIQGIKVCRYDGDVVLPPNTVKTQQDKTYHVFTPFSRQWHKVVTDDHLQISPSPKKQSQVPINSDDIAVLWPDINCHFREDLWPYSTPDITQRLIQFAAQRAASYKESRDIPSINGTSVLSPYLAMGAISVRQCIATLREHHEDWRSSQWITELIWREFYRHLTARYPHLSRGENFLSIENPIPWHTDKVLFQAWCDGKTGFPIVDAAMKQLTQTGWMHNRLRMITAAFLTKLLLIDWRWGEEFFMAHLIDGDYASNNAGWQWSASTGADAAPYFRIFNPYRQSERFDPEGKFIKKFLPELATLDRKKIHQPSLEDCQQHHYPQPIVDYKFARQRAIETFAQAMGKQP